MTKSQPQQTLREILAVNGDLRRKVQSAAVLAAYGVIKEAGYSITEQDIEEAKADQTAIAIALTNGAKGDNLPEVIIATSIGVAIASGGF
jgi:hypothetical protein